MFNFTGPQLMNLTGQSFLYVLVIILMISPILLIKFKPLQRKRLWLIKIRRYLGWLSGLLALSHLLVFLLVYTDSLSQLIGSLTSWWGLTGWISFIIIALLSLTSNDYTVRRLGRKWKKIHTLTYVVGPLVVIHALLALKGWQIGSFESWILIITALLIYRVKAVKHLRLPLTVVVVGYLGISSLNTNNVTSVSTHSAIDSVVDLDTIDTSHENYSNIWWRTAFERSEFWGEPNITYSEEAKAFCHGSYPVSIGDNPIYCADGRRS